MTSILVPPNGPSANGKGRASKEPERGGRENRFSEAATMAKAVRGAAAHYYMSSAKAKPPTQISIEETKCCVRLLRCDFSNGQTSGGFEVGIIQRIVDKISKSGESSSVARDYNWGLRNGKSGRTTSPLPSFQSEPNSCPNI